MRSFHTRCILQIKTLEKCDKVLWLNLNFNKQWLVILTNWISENSLKNRSRKRIGKHRVLLKTLIFNLVAKNTTC